MQLLLSKTQAGPGRAVKQEQEENSRNQIQSNPVNGSPDNGSILLLVQFMAGPTADPLSGSDCTWLGELSSCSCLTALPGPAWVLLSKIYKPFSRSLYNRTSL